MSKTPWVVLPDQKDGPVEGFLGHWPRKHLYVWPSADPEGIWDAIQLPGGETALKGAWKNHTEETSLKR